MDLGSLYEDVVVYDALGEHRTGSRGDVATTAWLERRLSDADFETSLQGFPAPVFQPDKHHVVLAGETVDVFPAWPPVTTAPSGLEGELADGGARLGKIALVRIPFSGGGAWAAPHAGDAVAAAIADGATAVMAVTEGPTGEVIALNTGPARFHWPVPVVIAGGGRAAALAAARRGERVRLVSTGVADPAGRGVNVVARRPGPGPTIVLSTPKSGWFHCAGERGSGLAIFLALAPWLARRSDADLVLVATAGHELGYGGGEVFLHSAPPPADVRFWLHIGANVAVQEVAMGADGSPVGSGRAMATRWLTAAEPLLAAAGRAFVGLAGYEKPRALSTATAVGEVELFHKAGYERLAGIVGAYGLFHTPLDRAPIATTPELLAPVAAACRALLEAVL